MPVYRFGNLNIAQPTLLFCGNEQCIPNHSSGPYTHLHYLMVFVHRGKGVFGTRNTTYRLSAGSTFFIVPGELTYYEADTNDPWEYSWIAFYDNTDEFLLKASISKSQPVHITNSYEELDKLYRKLIEVCFDKNRFVDLKIVSIFYDIMAQYLLTTNETAQIDYINSPMPKHIDVATSYVKKNFQKDISVEDIANHTGIAREYLSRLFKKHFRVSPTTFLRQYRLKNATTLLLTTDYSISEIAEMSGFQDYNYFSNQFNKLYNISPSKYREKIGGSYE